MNKFKKIYVEITNKCNLSCSFCSKSKRETSFLSVNDFSHIVKEIRPFTDYIYLHVKGEPLLHPNLDKILSICDENELKVNITTNGTLLSSVLDTLKKHSSLRQINVSLHSENNFPNYFKKVFNVCDELNSNVYISYRLWTLKDLKLDKKSTEIVEKIIKHYKLSTELGEKLYNDKSVVIKKGLYVNKENLFTWPDLNDVDESNGYCLGTITHLGILVNGTVVPCCLDGEGVVNLGNIFEDSFSDILKSDKFLKINNGFKNNKAICDLCKKCTYKNRF